MTGKSQTGLHQSDLSAFNQLLSLEFDRPAKA